MSATKTPLDDDQKFTLMKFKRNVQDVLQSQHDDVFLLRWLRARSWNIEAAEKMLRNSLKWRLQWEVDAALKEWTPPEVIQLYYPSGTCGFDKDGSPIIIVPFAGLDVVGMLHSTTRQDLLRTTIQIIEKNLQMAAQNNTHNVVVIFDMEGFNIRQYAWRPAAQFVVSIIQMYEANYPEILKVCYIINAPSVFAIAFNFIKRFLNECTIAKIQIFKKDPKKWKAAIAQNIAADNLPKFFGGNLEDPDGNPRYKSKINQGGKVPKSYYKEKLSIDETLTKDREFLTTVIKKGDKLTLEFKVEEDGCFLRWDFRTEEHDIRFGITLKDSNGNTSPAISHRRVASHQMDESGVLACQAPATYTVTFDNSYSVLRSKKLHYFVHLTPPVQKMNFLPSEEEMAELDANVESICQNQEVEVC